MAAAPPRTLETLFAEPPKGFTARRDALAAELAASGRADAAAAVKRLRKPTATLWAVNQLARRAPRDVEALVEAVQRLRRVQLRDARGASESMREQREKLDALAERAGEILTEAGTRATPEAVRKISSTLLGAAVDRRHAEDLRHGRLTEELSAPGFDILEGIPPGRPALRLVQKDSTARPGRDTAKARADQEARTRREKEGQERQRAAEELERRATEARAAASNVQRERDEARNRLIALERQARAARRAEKQATTAAKRARRTPKPR